MRRILDVQSYDPPAIAKGHQEWPHYTDKAPVGLPIEKDAVRLQVRTCCLVMVKMVLEFSALGDETVLCRGNALRVVIP